jgi:hypothetical protein
MFALLKLLPVAIIGGGGAWLKTKWDNLWGSAPTSQPQQAAGGISVLKIAIWLALIFGAVKVVEGVMRLVKKIG